MSKEFNEWLATVDELQTQDEARRKAKAKNTKQAAASSMADFRRLEAADLEASKGYSNPVLHGAATVADVGLNKPRETVQRFLSNQWEDIKNNPSQALVNAVTLQGLIPAAIDVYNGKKGLSGEDVSAKLGNGIGGKIAGLGYDILTDPLTYLALPKALTAGSTAAKIAKGAGIGAGFGAGQAFSQEASPQDIALSGLIGAGIGGGLTGAAEGIVKAVASKTARKSPVIELDVEELPGMDTAANEATTPDWYADEFGNVSRHPKRDALPSAERLALPSGKLALPPGEVAAENAMTRIFPVGSGEANIPNSLINSNVARSLGRPKTANAGDVMTTGIKDRVAPWNPASLDSIKKRYDEIINQEVQNLKSQIGGVETIGNNPYTMSDGSILYDGYRRESANPEWYRDFYAQNGRAPRAGEYRNIAIRNLIEGSEESGGKPDEEFLSILSELSRGYKLPDEWHGLQGQIRNLSNDPDYAPVVKEMREYQKGIEPYGLTRDMGRLNDIETGIRNGRPHE